MKEFGVGGFGVLEVSVEQAVLVHAKSGTVINQSTSAAVVNRSMEVKGGRG